MWEAKDMVTCGEDLRAVLPFLQDYSQRRHGREELVPDAHHLQRL